MNLEQLKSDLPEFAKDIKVNLGSVLSETGAPGLTPKQIASIALAAAFAARNQDVIAAVTEFASTELSAEEINAIKAAATIMAMNNVYYRFTHSMTDESYASMPANLRMTIMANPGIDKISFELSSVAVSAINGCSKCMNAHAAQLEKHEVSKQAIQSTVRIASVVYAAAVAREIG